MDIPLLAWAALASFVVIVLLIDLVAFGRNPHEVGIRESAIWSAVWMGLGLAFIGVMYVWQGQAAAEQYAAGFLLERALSIDNIFAFALIFGALGVPAAYRSRLLIGGIVGALVLRVVFIAAGTALLDAFHWTTYVFGAILLITAIKMARHDASEVHPERNVVLRGVRRVVPSTTSWHGVRLWVRENGRWLATPMVAAIVVVISTDIVFAVDSIPAIFAVTTEPFIVVAANVFALLGLRALYFLLEGMMDRFDYLQVGLAVMIGWVGVKMVLVDVITVPIGVSLAIIIGVLVISIGASMIAASRREARRDAETATANREVGT